eukprot:m.150296 g.150296  ORF g.150296 m.150296 type:complete len:56 (-) comp23294_c0_seq1:216-383(-)
MARCRGRYPRRSQRGIVMHAKGSVRSGGNSSATFGTSASLPPTILNTNRVEQLPG